MSNRRESESESEGAGFGFPPHLQGIGTYYPLADITFLLKFTGVWGAVRDRKCDGTPQCAGRKRGGTRSFIIEKITGGGAQYGRSGRTRSAVPALRADQARPYHYVAN
eukprot:scaffold50794_cov68-Phaeocystis_antarctica.AAC.8